MRLPTKSPFVHFRFSDGAQILMHSRGRSKAARASMSAIARRAAEMASAASDVGLAGKCPCSIVRVLYDGSARMWWYMTDADATRISREVSAMMAAGGAEHSAPEMSREEAG